LSVIFFFSSSSRHTRCLSDWSSDVCSSDLIGDFNIVMIGQSRRLIVGTGQLKNWPRKRRQGPGTGHRGETLEANCMRQDLCRERSEERRVGKGGADGAFDDDPKVYACLFGC